MLEPEGCNRGEGIYVQRLNPAAEGPRALMVVRSRTRAATTIRGSASASLPMVMAIHSFAG